MDIQRHFGCWLVAAALLGSGWPAASAQTTEASGATTRKARKAKNPKPPSDKGPAETRSERDQRLLRECRGRPNAGACEGYAN